MMMDSLVDYVLERGNKDYGQFAPRRQIDQTNALFNHRKMLEFLFSDHVQNDKYLERAAVALQADIRHEGRRDLGSAELLLGEDPRLAQQIYRKHLALDTDLYRLQNEWLKKKLPPFYCYYFLKFAYANSYSRLHQLVLSQIENMSKEKDSYWVIKKTIEAREVCLANLRRELVGLTQGDVEESLEVIRQENQARVKVQRQQGKELKGYTRVGSRNDEETGKSWRNKLEQVFEAVEHLRKLSCYVVELIKNWKTSVYNISEDPRRYRQRVIYYHHQANYLLKMLWDSNFIKDSLLNKHIQFATHFDPFILKPIMLLEGKQRKTEDQEIFLSLVKPTDQDMGKIVKSLIVLAEEEYDENQQTRFVNEKRNFGELEQRKLYIEKKRDGLGMRQQSHSEKKLPVYGAIKYGGDEESPKKIVKFSNDKKSTNLPDEIEQVQAQKAELQATSKLDSKKQIQTSLNRIQKIRSVDLKKISPYLSRNELLKKAQQVIEFEHKFRVAHNDYLQNIKSPAKNKSMPKMMDPKTQAKMTELIETNKQITNNRIFNKYIEENVRMLDQANKRAFLYKNRITPQKKSLQSTIAYNKLSFVDRKEAEYERNLHKYLPKETSSQQKFYQAKEAVVGESPSPTKRSTLNGVKTMDQGRKGTRAIIEISDRGIKAGEKIVEFELSGRKGKNLGSILESQDKANTIKTIEQKLNPNPNSDPSTSPPQPNLFTSQSPQQIIVLRQQPQKLQQLKKSLYQQIKQQLLQQLKNSQTKKQEDLNNMIEEEKRKKLQEIIEQKRLEEERRKEEEERMRVAQLEKERKKITLPVRVESIQYAQENLDEWWKEKVLTLHPQIFEKLFTPQSTITTTRSLIQASLHCIFLKGHYQSQQTSYCILTFNHEQQTPRKFTINYLCTKETFFYISTFHQVCEYMWKHDPVQEVEVVMYEREGEDKESEEGRKVVDDVREYAERNGEVFEKQLYSNLKEVRMRVYRPKSMKPEEMPFPCQKLHFSNKLNFKAQLLSSSFSLSQRRQPEIDMNLQTFTSYIFLLQELFRSYLTPEEIVELRENSTNIRRLKDIFRIVLELEKGKPLVEELTVVEGLNLEDLYAKMKDKLVAPYDRYYWNLFYDKSKQNRILLSILQTKLQFAYSINSAMINDRRMYRINVKSKLLVLKSSVYSKEDIYVLPTDNPKIRVFFMQGQGYKLMRIELFVFLNLVFNNIVQDNEKHINSLWVPQFCITLNNSQPQKKVKRITDFSISMKKSFFLSEEIYFCNQEYVRNGFSPVPRNSDVIFRESMIFGMLHTDVEKASTGMPIYAKLVDRNQYF